MPTGRDYALALTALILASGRAIAGPDWVEHNDAGSTLGTAQQTQGSGEIHSISGTLMGGTLVGDFEDMYLVRVLDPSIFSLHVVSAQFDPQLFVFNVTLPNEAFGLLANDNTPASNLPLLTAMATDGTGALLSNPGVYAIAISGAGRMPFSRTGSIFNYGSPTEISGADGPGGLNPLQNWVGIGQTGDYTIQCVGVGFYTLPAPGAGAVLCLGSLIVARRRRRTA